MACLKLKWAFSNPEFLRSGETRQALTERAAETFASLTQSLWKRSNYGMRLQNGSTEDEIAGLLEWSARKISVAWSPGGPDGPVDSRLQ